MSLPRAVVALGFLVVACPRESSGQIALGSEIAVNVYTSGDQDVPALAILPGGGFVAAWQSAGVDGDGTGVVARRFDSTGSGVGGEIPLSTGVAGGQNLPAIGADSVGNFVATWDSWAAPGDLSGYGVSARLFAAAGTPAGAEALVNTHTSAFQHASDIAVGPAGDFAVVWQDDGQVNEAQIYLRIFGANGSPATGEILVSDDAGFFRTAPAIARDSAGNLVVVWQAEEDGEQRNVYYRLYAADGDPITAGALATETVATDQKTPDVAMRPTGEFVIVWQSYQQDGDGWGVYARRFDANGDPAAGQSRVNLGTVGNQVEPVVGVASNGTFAVAFRDTAHGGILGRALSGAGTAYGGDFLISDLTPYDEASPALAMAANGDFTVAWTAAGYDGSGYSIRARRFVGDYLFRDSFESGDTQAWSGSVGSFAEAGAGE
ncbi:MAG: hypothetical protein U0X73_16315 [Thermoanaerobaculia bacterium]